MNLDNSFFVVMSLLAVSIYGSSVYLIYSEDGCALPSLSFFASYFGCSVITLQCINRALRNAEKRKRLPQNMPVQSKRTISLPLIFSLFVQGFGGLFGLGYSWGQQAVCKPDMQNYLQIVTISGSVIATLLSVTFLLFLGVAMRYEMNHTFLDIKIRKLQAQKLLQLAPFIANPKKSVSTFLSLYKGQIHQVDRPYFPRHYFDPMIISMLPDLLPPSEDSPASCSICSGRDIDIVLPKCKHPFHSKCFGKAMLAGRSGCPAEEGCNHSEIFLEFVGFMETYNPEMVKRQDTEITS